MVTTKTTNHLKSSETIRNEPEITQNYPENTWNHLEPPKTISNQPKTSHLSVFSPNARKYGPEKTPYLDTLHTVICLNEIT